MTDITMRELLKAGVHFGHQTRYWSPSMAPYIFGDRNKIHIINLDKTLPMLKEAMNYIGSISAQRGKVLFVGTKRQAGKLVKEQAIRCGSPYVDHRWLGGMLTNYKTVKNSIARLKELEQRIDSGATARLSKKEGLSLERERIKLDRTLAGIKDMNGLPDAVFIIDVEHEYIAVAEANKLGIPVVAIVDSNCSLKGIDYVIPGNDDSTRAIALYMATAADAILESRTVVKSVEIAPGDDEYVEVDEGDQAVASVSSKVAASNSAGTGQTTPSTDAGTDETMSSNEEQKAAEETVAPKKVVKKRVVKKKVVKKKVVSKKAESKTTDDEESDATAEAGKKVAKSKVTKKTAS